MERRNLSSNAYRYGRHNRRYKALGEYRKITVTDAVRSLLEVAFAFVACLPVGLFVAACVAYYMAKGWL